MTFQSRETTEVDATLLPRIARRDERALGALYDRHGARAYALAIAILKDPSDAEEVVGDAFSQVWRTAASFDGRRGSVSGWIATITRSRALDRLRSRRRSNAGLDNVVATGESAIEEFVAGPSPDAAATVETDELRAQVRRALTELTPPQREVVSLAYFGGLSHSEIAAHLGAPLGTVKTRVRAAMDRLRVALAPLRGAGL